MRLPPRRQLTASSGAPPPSTNNNKRKERDDGFDGLKPSHTTSNTSTTNLLKPKADSEPPDSTKKDGSEPPSSSLNHLLAGYLAHEFLTKGTIMGQVWDPSRAEERKGETISQKEGEAEPDKPELRDEKRQRYVEVAGLLMMDGTHIHRLVNPTEFVQFL